ILGNVTNINDYRQTEGKLAAGMVERGGNNAVNELLPRPIDRRRVQIDLGNKTYTCNLYGRLYQYGEERIGVNQHTIALNVEKGGMNLQILRDQVRAKYPRMKVSEIDKFLWSMEGADGSLGICNYADVANAIFNYYTQIPDGANTFQQQFGFPMFGTDGRVNGRQLLVDMMLDISGDKLITKKGLFKGFTAEENNRGYRNLAKPIYDNMTEQYDIKLIKDYVSKRGINPDNVNEIFLFDSNDKVKMYGDYRLQADTVLVEVYNSLVQGKHVSLVGTSNLVLYDIANQNYTKLAGAHIMSIYGIDANGNLLVDSWGRRFAINIDMALQSNSRIRLAVLSMEQPRIQNQNLGNISVNDYNQIIEHAIRVMNAKNAQDSRYYSGYAALERYILEGKIEHFTSTDNVRQLIQNVPREYVRKYMEQVRQIQQQYNQILKYALDTMNQKYGDGFTRLEAYVNGQGPNVLTSTGDVRRLVTQVPVDYIRGYLNAISNSYNNNYGMQRGSMEAVIEDGNIVTSRENDYDINVSVDADGEYLTEEDIKEKSGWNMFLDSLFNTPNKEQFTTIADQKIFSHNELPKSITNSKIYTKYQSLEETNYYDDNGNQISTIKNLRDLSDSEIIDLINLIKKYNEYQDMYYTELDIAKHMELSEMFDAVNNEILQGRKIPTRKYQQYIL
ncbi:MAG: hypothetical protein IKI04_02785, partial [Bacilli bacterium]|nr:hypothetical protein [Bacilli bacterium]